MTKSAPAISLAVLTNINAAAHSQNSVVANPVLEGTAHPGTALLDSAGIYAGVPTPNVVLVHPGTALLDSMGIFAGEPVAVPIVDGSTAVGETVTLK
jgi:hypothetical protein